MAPGRKTSIRTVHRSACSIVVALIVVASVHVINAAPTTTAVVQGRDRRDATQQERLVPHAREQEAQW